MPTPGRPRPSSTEPNCIFCSIARGNAPAAWVAKRERAVAFLTLGPLRPGHTLVIPRAHAVTVLDVSPEDWRAVTDLALEVARLQRERLGAAGHSLLLASGHAGEQSVLHLHLHVVPRHEGDGVDLNSWWEGKVRPAAPPELESVARQLRGESG